MRIRKMSMIYGNVLFECVSTLGLQGDPTSPS